MAITAVPVVYPLTVKRGRHSDHACVREIVPVQIGEIGADEAPVAIIRPIGKYTPQDETEQVRWHAGRLWAPFRERFEEEGRPITIPDFEALCAGAVEFHVPGTQYAGRTPVTRTEALDGATRVTDDGRDRFVRRVEESFASMLAIDGIVHQAIVDPVWRVTVKPPELEVAPISVTLDHYRARQLWGDSEHFRADRGEEAMAFARAIARRLDRPIVQAPVRGEVLDPAVLSFEDLGESVRRAVVSFANPLRDELFFSLPDPVVDAWYRCRQWSKSPGATDPAEAYATIKGAVPLLEELRAKPGTRNEKMRRFAGWMLREAELFVTRIETCEPSFAASADAELAEMVP